MRFLMMMIPRVYQPSTPDSERAGEGFAPSLEEMEPMMKFNEELAKAGALLALDGLHPQSKGARVSFTKGSATVTDGPFIESKEVIGGYWIIDVKSKEEAVAWMQRCPAADGDVIEIRPIFEMSDFPMQVQQASKDMGVREQLEKQAGR